MDKLKIYLDNCCYNRPFDDQTRARIAVETQAKLIIQSLVKTQRVELWRHTVRNTATIMKEGIECLLKHFGALETEISITNILKEPLDYTEWQKQYFSNFSLEELNQMAVRYNQENPVKDR